MLLCAGWYEYTANVTQLPNFPVNRAVLRAKVHRNTTVKVNEAFTVPVY